MQYAELITPRSLLIFLGVFIVLLFVRSMSRDESESKDVSENIDDLVAIVNYYLGKSANMYVKLCRKKVSSNDFRRWEKNYYVVPWNQFKNPTVFPFAYSLHVDIWRHGDGSYTLEYMVVKEHPFAHNGLGAKHEKKIEISPKNARKIIGRTAG